MNKRKLRVMLAVGLAIACLLLILGYRAELQRRSRIIPMPKGYEGIYVGLRANALPVNYDITYSTDAFIHSNPTNTFLPRGWYWCKNILEVICWEIGSIDLEDRNEDIEKLRGKIPGLVQGAIQLWGNANAVNATSSGETTLTWYKKGVTIDIILLGRFNIHKAVIYNNRVRIYAPENRRMEEQPLTVDLKEIQSAIGPNPDIINYNGPILQ